MTIEELLTNPKALERGRRAVENVLIDCRDSRISIVGAANGCVVRERDGSDSHVIRLGIIEVLTIALHAVVEREGE